MHCSDVLAAPSLPMAWHHHRVHARSTQAVRRLIRRVYYAPHAGYAMHMDATSKCQEYGIHVEGAMDGCTNYVLALMALTDLLMYTVYSQVTAIGPFLPSMVSMRSPPRCLCLGRCTCLLC